MVKCVHCGEIKSHAALGLCKFCYDKQWRENNKDKVRKHAKKFRDKNKEKIRKHDKEYRMENNDKERKRHKAYRKRNKDKEKEGRFIKCASCGEIKPFFTTTQCCSCYGRKYRKTKAGKVVAAKRHARQKGYGATILMPDVFPVPSEGHHLKDCLFVDDSSKSFVWYLPKKTHTHTPGSSSDDGHWTFCGKWIKKLFCMSVNGLLNGTDFMRYDAWPIKK